MPVKINNQDCKQKYNIHAVSDITLLAWDKNLSHNDEHIINTWVNFFKLKLLYLLYFINYPYYYINIRQK